MKEDDHKLLYNQSDGRTFLPKDTHMSFKQTEGAVNLIFWGHFVSDNWLLNFRRHDWLVSFPLLLEYQCTVHLLQIANYYCAGNVDSITTILYCRLCRGMYSMHAKTAFLLCTVHICKDYITVLLYRYKVLYSKYSTVCKDSHLQGYQHHKMVEKVFLHAK